MNGLRRYAVAVGAVGLSTLCRWLVDGWLGDYLPFVTYFAAVALVGLYAGLGPAILSTIGGGLIGDYLFMPPRATLALNGSELWLGLTLFFIMSTVIITVPG